MNIVHLPGFEGRKVSFGVYAACGLSRGRSPASGPTPWAAPPQCRSGSARSTWTCGGATIPAEVRYCTFAGLRATDDFIEREPGQATAVRVIVKVLKALRADPSRAAQVEEGPIPKDRAELITGIVERNAPFYEPAISEKAVAKLNAFAQSVGYLPGPVAYEQVAAVQFRGL